MDAEQEPIEEEIIYHLLGSFQNEDPCNYKFSKEEALDYLKQAFAALKSQQH